MMTPDSDWLKNNLEELQVCIWMCVTESEVTECVFHVHVAVTVHQASSQTRLFLSLNHQLFVETSRLHRTQHVLTCQLFHPLIYAAQTLTFTVHMLTCQHTRLDTPTFTNSHPPLCAHICCNVCIH